jgi:hypothetical protein
MLDKEPAARRSSTLTAYSFVPGATPTTPLPVLRPASVPATCVPCPLSSWADAPAVMQLTP